MSYLYFDRIHGAYKGIWIWDNFIYIDMILFVTVQFGGNLTQIKWKRSRLCLWKMRALGRNKNTVWRENEANIKQIIIASLDPSMDK